jgi:nicotinate-nucleotide adenylyltransferase
MKVAVFGGSFDPPHIGHEEIIKKSLQNLDIEALFVIPTYLNPFKNSFLASEKLRLKWVKKLLLPYPKAKIISYEVEQKRSVPTIETIKYLKSNYDLDEIYLIIGADNLKSLDQWKDYEELKKLVHFVVASRDKISIPKDLQKLQINANISSTKLRNDPKIEFLPKSIADEVMEFYKQRREMNKLVDKIVEILDEKKAENIQLFDMRGKDYIVDDVIIATTLNPKHGLSLADHLKKEIKKMGEKILEIEESDEWSVIDLGDMLIHLMSPEYRTKYNLEEFLSQRDEKRGY